jgi:hypothetical protein
MAHRQLDELIGFFAGQLLLLIFFVYFPSGSVTCSNEKS